MRVSTNTQAPDFRAESVRGTQVSLYELRGRPTLLKFYRFAGCPICNLHLRELARRHGELEAAGLTTVIFFHSPEEIVEREIGKELPFELVADPDKRIFAAYGVEASLRGMFTGQVARDYGRAMAAGYRSKPLGHHGGITGHPADFILDADGVIRHAHYGTDYSDSLGVEAAIQAAQESGALTPLAGSIRR